MSDNYSKITFAAASPYVDDRGTNRTINTKFSIPPGVTAATVTSITTAIGAIPRGAQKVICPPLGFKPRRLQFFSSGGGSVSIPFFDRTAALLIANQIRTALDANGFGTVCVKLLGEEFDNLADALRPNGFTLVPSATSSRPAAGGLQPSFHGKANYLSDAIYGSTYVLSYKIQSDVALTFPSIYTPVAALTGITPLAPGLSACFGGDSRTTRRYLVQSLVIENAIVKSQRAEIPSFIHTNAGISALGLALAGLTHVQCLGYKGESNNRLIVV